MYADLFMTVLIFVSNMLMNICWKKTSQSFRSLEETMCGMAWHSS